MRGLSRVEYIFLGLFSASLLLTMITISVAIAVVHVHRKRNQNNSQECSKCSTEVRLNLEENAHNSQTLKRQTELIVPRDEYERGLFGDTVYIRPSRSAEPLSFSMFTRYDNHLRPDMLSNMAAHTYDSIASASRDVTQHSMDKHVTHARASKQLARDILGKHMAFDAEGKSIITDTSSHHTYETEHKILALDTGQETDVRVLKAEDTTDANNTSEIISNHENTYANIANPYHVVISPKTGKREMRFDRRNSVS